METTKKFLGAGLALAIFTIATTTSVFAYQGDPAVQGPDFTPERHEIMEKAFEAGDYDSWAAQMEGKGRIAQVVNADNFDLFSQAHDLAEQGKFEEAKAIRAELGLGLKNGEGRGQGQGLMQGQGQGLKDGSGQRGGGRNM